MKAIIFKSCLAGGLVLAIFNPPHASLFAQTTAFTYQGRLEDGAIPVNGSYDLMFVLFDAETGGSQIPGPLTLTAIPISNGLFTVMLAFPAGAGAFPGADRWLEISARTNGGGAFATLSPRQELTPTPYAITAQNLASGGGLNGTYGNPVTFSNANNVFSGSFSGNGAGVGNVNAVTLGGVPAAGFWKTTGNAGTTPDANLNFLGTTDPQPFEIHVNSLRVLRLEPTPSGAPNIIAGGVWNTVDPGIQGATIAGGGALNYAGRSYTNRISANFAVIGGGAINRIGSNADDSVIGGGQFNTISSNAYDSVIVGGNANSAQSSFAAIGGGQSNENDSSMGTVGGGFGNWIQGSADNSVIGGGFQNTVQTGATNATIAGGSGNAVLANAIYATLGGGLQNACSNSYATLGGGTLNTNVGQYATLSGGALNLASGAASMVGGGYYNTASGNYSTSGGGYNCWAQGDHSFVGGGFANTVYDSAGTVGGGELNSSSGFASTVPGGYNNYADGACSFAAGQSAKASHNNAFVWNAFSGSAFSFWPARFHVFGTNGLSVDYYTQRADGGGDKWILIGAETQFPGQCISTYTGAYLSSGGAWVPNSDRSRKEKFAPVNARGILKRVEALPLRTWNYTNEPVSVRHLGPMAQDFHAAFGLNGEDDKHIADIDEGGVALAAIQGLSALVKEKDDEIQALRRRLDRLEKLISAPSNGGDEQNQRANNQP